MLMFSLLKLRLILLGVTYALTYTQLKFTCSKSTIRALEKGVKFVQS